MEKDESCLFDKKKGSFLFDEHIRSLNEAILKTEPEGLNKESYYKRE